MVRVGLFANQGSVQLAEIAEAVAAEGARPVVCDIQVGGPQPLGMVGPGGPLVTVSDERLRWGEADLTDVRAVHVRCTSPRTLPALPPVLNQRTHAEYAALQYREQEFNAATWTFLEAMAERGALVANLLRGYVEHDTKGQLYPKLADAGFPAPRTITTTDPEAARAFQQAVGRMVVKPAVGVGSTRLVHDFQHEMFEEMRTCPTLLQEYVEGDTVRVHVVGDSMVLALRILSDGHFVDSRTAPKAFEYLAMAEEEQARIVAATRFLGLHYAAWDVLMAPDGRIAYLDCNPGPSVMWIGEANRRAVFARLARYLVTFARSGSVAEAAAAVTPVPAP